MKSESLFLNEFPDYIIRKLLYRSDTRRIKMYFHVVYGGGRRRYGGAGRNSLKSSLLSHEVPSLLKKVRPA